MSFYVFRPLDHWPVDRTPEYERRSKWTFKAKWHQTLDLLEKELERLDARNVVLQVDCDSSKIRVDGGLRANATPTTPGVIIAFDSKHGPLSYPCDSCDFWQHNVRSIALALQALRKVDLYGVTGRAEQYRGWTKIARPGEHVGFNSRGDAMDFVCDLLEIQPAEFAKDASGYMRKALTLAHPDHGGTAKRFKLVQAAKEKIFGGAS